MRILRVIHSLDPESGGTVEGALQTSRWLKSKGHQIELASFDPPHSDFLDLPEFKTYGLGSSYPRYGYNSDYIKWLRNKSSEIDAVIVEGIWQYQCWGTYRALRGTDTPYYVYTHGMLDPWFHEGHPLKYLKKLVYWLLADRWALKSAASVFFTTEEEKLLAKTSMPFSDYASTVVPFGIETPSVREKIDIQPYLLKHPECKGKRNLLFMSRIHPKKGCDLLIQAFAKVIKEHSDIHLLMAGPDQTGWKEELLKIAETEGVSESITWLGMVKGEEKEIAFQISEAFVLPSHQENFGIVVAESLSRGMPVLITNKVNIWREVHDSDAGWVEEDNLSGVERMLFAWAREEDISRFREPSLKCFRENFELSAIMDKFIGMIGGKEPTDRP